MKKVLFIFAVSLLLCAITYNCYYTMHCGMLKEKLMFVPQNMEKKGDHVVMYSNRGDTSIYVVWKIEPVKLNSYTSDHRYHGCADYFLLDYMDIFTSRFATYELRHSYENEWSNPVYVNISLSSYNGRSKFSFEYTVNRYNTLHTISTALLDSIMVNKVCYRKVVELQDSVQTVHVAKDYGIVQIVERDSTVWALNKW